MVTPVTPNTVTPHGYATRLCQIRLRRLRQTHLWHVADGHIVTPVTPNTVTQHGYAIYGYAGYAEFGYAIYGYVGYANIKHIYGMELVVC